MIATCMRDSVAISYTRYNREACLACPPNGPVECMPLPSVSHQRNKYSVIKKNGIQYIQQHFVGVQDFRQVFFLVLCFFLLMRRS